MFSNKHISSGFAALMLIVVIGLVVLTISLTAAISGVQEAETSFDVQKGQQAFDLADGCVEDTLRRIKTNSTYGIGDGTIDLTFTDGSCQISVSDLGNNQRRVTSVGQVDNYYQQIQVELTTTNDTITLNSWAEN